MIYDIISQYFPNVQMSFKKIKFSLFDVRFDNNILLSEDVTLIINQYVFYTHFYFYFYNNVLKYATVLCYSEMLLKWVHKFVLLATVHRRITCLILDTLKQFILFLARTV